MEPREYFDRVDEAYTTLTGEAVEERLRSLTERSGEEYGRRSPLYAAMLSELGGYYRGQRNCEASERSFRLAMELLAEIVGEDSPDYATVVNNLAGTYRLAGRYEDADAAFSKALDIYGRTVGENHILYASALNNLSLVALDRGNLPRAAELLERASAILEHCPEALEEYGASLCNLGALERRLGHWEKAKVYLQRAAKLHEDTLGTVHPHYHTILNLLGLTCYDAGEYAEACRWLEQSLGAARRLYGEEHQETCAIADHLRLAQEAVKRKPDVLQ